MPALLVAAWREVVRLVAAMAACKVASRGGVTAREETSVAVAAMEVVKVVTTADAAEVAQAAGVDMG